MNLMWIYSIFKIKRSKNSYRQWKQNSCFEIHFFFSGKKKNQSFFNYCSIADEQRYFDISFSIHWFILKPLRSSTQFNKLQAKGWIICVNCYALLITISKNSWDSIFLLTKITSQNKWWIYLMIFFLFSQK